MYESCTCNVSRLYLSFFTLYFFYIICPKYDYLFLMCFIQGVSEMYIVQITKFDSLNLVVVVIFYH